MSDLRPEVGIGIVGYGGIARAHAYGWAAAPRFRDLPCRPRLVAMSGRDAGALARAAQACGVAETHTDWRALVDRPDVDVVDICTPPGSHAAIIEAAAEAGKAILCEKPLGVEYEEVARAAGAAARAGVLNAIGFNYRRLPAVALMKRMIDEGAIGEPLTWRAIWLTDEFLDPEVPFDWRFERASGASTIADLGSHLLDLGQWMIDGISAVAAQSRTFTSERTDPATGAQRPVDVDEASAALVRFRSGPIGVLEVSRVAARRPCDLTLEANGSNGTLRFDYPRLNELWYGDAREPSTLYGMRRIRAEHPTHPYAERWWPLGQGIGWGSSFVNQAADLLERWPGGPWDPDLATGLRVQAVCAAIERSAAEGRWVEVSEIVPEPSSAESRPVEAHDASA